MAATACVVLLVLTFIFTIQSNNEVDKQSKNSDSTIVKNEIKNRKKEVNFKPWKKNRTEAIIQAENAAYVKLKEEIDNYHDSFKNNKTKIFFIYPGTKWCGAGDSAWGYNDLGVFRRVDICCRDHDHCSDYISAFTTKYGLSNYSPIGKLLCSCDLQFLSCLQTVNSTVSQSVGDIYFNILGNQCFKEDYPIVKCKKYYTSNSNRCEEYEFDTTKAKKYQYFDIPPFI